jgi:molybdenum cofactor cytidylyltransferase
VNARCSIAGVILSAGASRRMGTPKALLRLESETFLDRLIRLFSAHSSPIVVVLGPHADQIRSGIDRAALAQFVVNPDPNRGMLSSLQCGLAAAPDVDAALFTPVDHPGVDEATLRKIVHRFEATRAPVVIPEYQGQHGHPVLVARPLIAELLALPVTGQASDVIHRYRSETAYVPVDDAAVTTDVDDPEAYAQLLSRTRP